MSLDVELYEFKYGTVRAWHFTSGATPVDYGGFTYQPSSITRDKITKTSDPIREPLSLTFPRTDPFASLFIGTLLDFATTVTVYRGVLGGGAWSVVYKGRIVETSASGNEINLSCESIYTAIQRDGLQARYEYSCRHLLYSNQCGANRDSYTVTKVVASNDGTTLTVTTPFSQADQYFKGGIVQFSFAANRYILSQVGTTLTLNRAIAQIIPGQNITVSAGCDRSKSTCVGKFNNVLNFGGFPWIPVKNPFDGRIN